jgi:UPF0176 protein
MRGHAFSMQIINISAYKFISLDDTVELRPRMLEQCTQRSLKGTILLAPEGINMFLAGTREAIDGFMGWLKQDPRFADIEPKESPSADQPFKRMLVRLKNEIITMRMPLIRPEEGRAPSVAPVTLKRWLDQGHDDDGREIVLLDTRNAFEVDVGTFEQARDYRISKFTEFPEQVAAHRDEFEGKTVVSFCTGGIRCEKAAIHMQEAGIEHVYQLEGGILKYFEEVGGEHYAGDCFVFDYRTALNPQLLPAGPKQCFACRAVVTPLEQKSPDYTPGVQCPHCAPRKRAAQSGAPA